MTTLLWLAMIAGQILAIVKFFGGLKDSPKWLDITIGIMLVFMLISMFGLAMDS